MSLEREQAATPTLNKSFSENLPSVQQDECTLNLDMSFLSGYEGDREDEESFMDASSKWNHWWVKPPQSGCGACFILVPISNRKCNHYLY